MGVTLLSPPVLLVGALYAIFIVLRYLGQLYHHRKQAKSLHCQPPRTALSAFFGIPAFIRLTKAVREKRWVDYLDEHHVNYGNTFIQRFLSRRMINTIEPENVKAILATQFQDFSLGIRHEQFYPLLGDGIFTLDGAGWSHARSMLRPQFTRDQVADLTMLDDHITHLIDRIPKDRSAFDIQRLFFLLTMDSATHFLFGESVGCMLPPSETGGILERSAVGSAQGFADAFTTAQDYLSSRTRAQEIYWLINPKEFREATRRVHEVVDHYVNLALESKRHPERKETSGRYVFLQALAADTDDPNMLRDYILNILLAGRDTTASLLSSTFFYLARNPKVWNRLRREIIEEFGDSDHPRAEITHAKLKDIPYLRYVLNEVLRLQPPVPMNFRVAIKDTSLPVGGGPRICLGQQYALTEASYTVIRLLQHFDTLENADPHSNPGQEPVKLVNLTMMHDSGVPVRLYSSQKL